jgi:hypothetical protein
MPINESTSAGTETVELFANQTRSTPGVVRDRVTPEFELSDSPASVLQRRMSNSARSGYLNPNSNSQAVDRFNKYLGFDNKYDYNYRVFPDNLGAEESAHYMVININVPVNSEGKARTNAGFGPSLFGPANYQTLEGEYSKVDQLKFPNGVPGGYEALQDINKFASFNIPRGTRRIKESIALFMPVPMVYTHTNVYEEISMTALGAQALKLGVSAIGKAIAGALTQRLDRATQGGLPTLLGVGGESIRKLASLAGYPINPKIEVMFSHTPQRAFRMELLMAPKNQKESETVKNIIDTLRYHAAPEISGNGPIPGTNFGAGIIPLFIPPAEFDITFYHKGKENTKIPRINTCAIEQIEVDYAPSGIYSTFTNGYPVQVRLSLAFRELEILHKERVAQGF